MKAGVPKETAPGERRVALIPDSVPALKKTGLEVSTPVELLAIVECIPTEVKDQRYF